MLERRNGVEKLLLELALERKRGKEAVEALCCCRIREEGRREGVKAISVNGQLGLETYSCG